MRTLAAWVSTIGIAIYVLSVILLIGFYLYNQVLSVQRKRSAQWCKRRLPCGQCVYFTGETLLPCAVNPTAVLTDEAINCRDFRNG